jgi:hypothetical protein
MGAKVEKSNIEITILKKINLAPKNLFAIE